MTRPKVPADTDNTGIIGWIAAAAIIGIPLLLAFIPDGAFWEEDGTADGMNILLWCVGAIFSVALVIWLLAAAVSLFARMLHPQPGDIEKVGRGIVKGFFFTVFVIPIGGILAMMRRF